MKNLIGLLLSLFGILSLSGESLPILEVSFPGQSLGDDYVYGSMKLTDTDGSVTELPAMMKLRGATARNYTMKPSFNMKLENEAGDEFDTNLLNLREASSFILDAMAIDRICMRNRVCFDIWHSMYRLPYETDFGSRDGTVGKFVEVYLNGDYKGIYCLSDKINRKLLDLKKPQEEDGKITIRGVLYKNGTTDISDQNTPGFFNDSLVYVGRWHDAWELHEPEDYAGMEAWAPLVEYYSDGNLNSWNYIQNHFFEDNLVDYTLFVMALCIQDNWGSKNKYFSIQNITGKGDKNKFIVTPWDLDTSLGGAYDGSHYNGNYSSWSPRDIMNSASAPFGAALAQQSIREKLKTRWIELRSGCLSVDSVTSRMYDYCDLFENSGAWEKYVTYWNGQSNRPKYVENLRSEIDQISAWYAARVESLDNYFGVDNETSSTEMPHSDDNASQSVIYDLKGNIITQENLRRGMIYIQDGKKFICD